MSSLRATIARALLAIALVTAALVAATQWAAAMLAYQPALGLPWLDLVGIKVYVPWKIFVWWLAFDAQAPEVFARAGAVAALGGTLSGAVAVGGAAWRAGQKTHVTTYGSARWADFRDVRNCGLLAETGPVLGLYGGRYLRHDGPEHVLAVAPTRSGKGVGLVVPTLLTWPGSAVIHDVKGENWALTAGWRAQFSHCLLFDPTNPSSARFNPLLEVRKGLEEVRDVQNIADILVGPEGAGVVSTAMSFLRLYRDPIIAATTARSDWRIADLVGAERPVSLYPVVPPSDISRTRPLVRLILNQIGRRLTERLDADAGPTPRRQLLLMLDEFPALGRLDFFEFVAGVPRRLRRQGLPGGTVAAPDRQGLRAQSRHPRQLPRTHCVRSQRRAHGQATVRRARDRDGDAGTDEPLGAPPRGLAVAHVDVAAGDAASVVDPGRDPTAASHGRAGAGVGYAADPRQEAQVFRRPQLPDPPAPGADAGRRPFFSNFVTIVVLMLAWLVVLLAFFVLSVQLFITIIEFKLTVLAGFVLVPFALFGQTAFLAERVLGNVISSGIKLMVLAIVVGIGASLFGTLIRPTGEITLTQAASTILAAIAVFGLAVFVPGIAAGLVSGAPQLGAGAAVATTAALGGTAVAGGMLTAGAARLAGRAAGGSIKAAASMTGRVGAAHGAGGMGGVARTTVTAPASRMVASATGPVRDAYREGAAQGYRDAGPGPRSPGPGPGQTSGGPAPPDPPAWAQSLARRQRLTQAGLVAAQALREGDRPGGGAGPELKDKS